MVADIVVFDKDTIIEKSDYDEPRQFPEGILYVLIGGEVVVEDNKYHKKAVGKIIRKDVVEKKKKIELLTSGSAK
jgi:N-acyl-D-amino-acid deacylase